MTDKRIVLLGEAMLELSHPEGVSANLSYGGDMLNTSIYLARFGLHPHFVTALGSDPYSDGILKEFERECVQTSHVLRDPGRLPGIYAIQTDHMGERSFYYWRTVSAARNFFNLPGAEASIDFAQGADILVVSGITLSIFNELERRKLGEIAQTVKAKGGEVVFDPNYRPAKWNSHQAARTAKEEFAKHATTVLTTIDDDNILYSQMPGKDHAARWFSFGVDTVVLKCGAKGAMIYQPETEGLRAAPTLCDRPVDTTGAGDSFNAGFIAGKCKGLSNEAAAIAGNKLASHVIRYSGAIMPAADMPDVFK